MRKGLFKKTNYRVYGDCGLLIECGDAIDPDVNNKVRSITAALENDPPTGVTEIVPAAEFYRAEDYHQDYLQKNPNGYTCHYLRD